MNREIPGYFYDEEKKKYFKIEKSHTAPTSAAWSSDSVKRRKLDAEKAQSAHRRAERVRNHTKRPRVLAEPLLGGLLNRELGAGRGVSLLAGPEFGPDSNAAVSVADISGAAYADALIDKGRLPFIPSFSRERHPNLPCFWIGGDDQKTGVGIAYATADECTLTGAYVPTDDEERISFSSPRVSHFLASAPQRYMHWQNPRLTEISSIGYSRKSHDVVVTSRQLTQEPGVSLFRPRTNSPDEPSQPQWLLERQEERSIFLRQQASGFHPSYSVNHALSVPASSAYANDLICTLGTNKGVLLVNGNRGRVYKWHTSASSEERPLDVLAQCFHESNPSSVVLAGTRAGGVHLLDLRHAPDVEKRSLSFRHASAVTHLKTLTGINGNHVLVSGLRSTMAVYDLRFVRKGDDGIPDGGETSRLGGGNGVGFDGKQLPRKGKSKPSNHRGRRGGGGGGGGRAEGRASRDAQPTTPILTFPSYRNEAHTQIGLDVHPDAGIVAAAHDDGTVALYSLLSGRRLRSPAVDVVGSRGGGYETGGVSRSEGRRGGRYSRGGEGRGRDGSRERIADDALLSNDTPVKSLMFRAMPWERHESLWLGIGSSVKKLSV